MRIATWNVNSIRARIDLVTAFLNEVNPDILLLQETKVLPELFPYDKIKRLGYDGPVLGEKAYNGVAALSRYPVTLIDKTLPLLTDEDTHEARYLEVEIHDLCLACIYVPNGNPTHGSKFPFKLRWLNALCTRACELFTQERPVLIAGDYNICPDDQDCFAPEAMQDDALLRSEVRAHFRYLLNKGYTDLLRLHHPQPGHYTFWDYQGGAWAKDHGLRIDHMLASPEIADRCSLCWIDHKRRGAMRASDHVPLICDLKDPEPDY